MALKPCPRCGNRISDKATKCPKCGAKLSQKDFSKNGNIQQKVETPLENHDYNGDRKPHNKRWMMITFPLVIIGIVVGCIFYFNNEKKNNEALMIAEKARQDSIIAVQQEAERLEQQRRQDSIIAVQQEAERLEQQRQDSIARRNFVTPDLALFNLHARVKTLETHNNVYLSGLLKGAKIEFDENGIWTNYKNITVENGCKISSITRNKNGYITRIDYIDGDPCSYTFTWKDGKVVNCHIDGYEFGADYIFRYKDNQLLSIESEGGAFECDEIKNLKFSEYQIDKWGNWIECKVITKSWLETTVSDYGNITKKQSDFKEEISVLKQTLTYYNL